MSDVTAGGDRGLVCPDAWIRGLEMGTPPTTRE